MSIIATPFGYIMRLIYQIVGSYGVSIILFAILAKVVTLPLTIKQKRSMQKTQRLQPKMQALQKKYGKDQQRYNQELQALYQQEGVSPMGGCGTTLLSFPIMIGLYYVISRPLSYFMQLSTEQIAEVAARLGLEVGANSEIMLAGAMYDNFPLIQNISDKILHVEFRFLGIDMAAVPSFKEFNLLWIIPILSGLTAFGFSMFQRWVNNKANPAAANDQAAKMTNSMLFIMPLMSVYFGFILPAGLGMYWIINNILSSIQEYALSRFLKPLPEPEPPPPKKKKKPKPVLEGGPELEKAPVLEAGTTPKPKAKPKPKPEVLDETPMEEDQDEESD